MSARAGLKRTFGLSPRGLAAWAGRVPSPMDARKLGNLPHTEDRKPDPATAQFE
jgi:hypothetical protein